MYAKRIILRLIALTFTVTAQAAESDNSVIGHDDYLKQHRREFEWFVHAANSYQGIPFLLLRVLPELEPEIWGTSQERFARFGFSSVTEDLAKGRVLPTALAWDSMVPTELRPPSGPFRSVSLTCAACHVGQVRTEKNVLDLVGAPNTQVDVRAWRHAFELTVEKRMSSSGDLQKFAQDVRTAIEDKPDGYFYQDSEIDRERTERKAFLASLDQILPALASRIRMTRMTVDLQRITNYSKDNRPPLNGGSVGQSDGSGDLIPKLLLLEDMQRALSEPVPEPAIARALSGFLGKPHSSIQNELATVTDNLSTWNQGKRNVAQLDGSVRSPFFRNVAAILAVAGDPTNVNVHNAVETAKFLEALPPPAYPFSVRAENAEAGRLLFMEHCAVCHFDGNDKVYADLGTDMNRARVLNSDTVNLFLKHFVASVPKGFKYVNSHGKTIEPLLLAPDDIVNADRAIPGKQGYLADGLHGIWARAPYLHNGSVPTLRHLLGPTKDRPQRFVRGCIDYDVEGVGFDWDSARLEAMKARDSVATSFNTQWDGCSNAGHDTDVIVEGKLRKLDWSDDKIGLANLLEFLKAR